jgi:predicted RNA-binding Zn-ribbon protein involved in translation (DUF1610 family)
MDLQRSQMTVSTPILALATYPLLYNLPLNPIRFLWGFRQGLAPMPPEVQEKAEAADRAVLFGMHVTVLTVVLLLMNGSSLSAYAVGLTTNNWKSAILLGALVSFIPQGIAAILLRSISPHKLREDSESHGPLATWCGLNSLGSLSIELWRAFCIAALISLDTSPWIAVLIVALVSGASNLSTSTARAAGSAFFGGLAGLLFVNTGSLLAPLTMSLIGAGANLYRLRRIPPKMVEGSEAKSPYRACPACSAVIPPSGIPFGNAFPCPSCGEWVTYDNRFSLAIWPVSILVAIVTTLHLGFRDGMFFFIAECATFLLGFVGLIFVGILIMSRILPQPPIRRVKGKPFDSIVSLHLDDKSERNKRTKS